MEAEPPPADGFRWRALVWADDAINAELLEALQRLAKLIPVAADCKGSDGNQVTYTDAEWEELVAVTPMVYAAIEKATA